MSGALARPLTLPCGATLPNRLAKAAMTEGVADVDGAPSEALARLYGIWSDGGAGLLLSGNIQIDRAHLERPGNVIIDTQTGSSVAGPGFLDAMRVWTAAATRNGNHFWAQLSHAGRQTQASVNPRPKAPSAVKLGLPGGQFGEPVALSEDEIRALIGRFAAAAALCREGGFTGVQIHAAHGYLLSQFLNPRANRRTDDWGGSLANRARMLLDTVAAVRASVGKDFPIAVKLNSADFQRGGFAFEDSLTVAQWLQDAGVDCIEVSGGNYEQPKLLGMVGLEAATPQHVAATTLAREAYFIDFAAAMRATLTVPLMVTGGFRSRAAMEQAIDEGAADIIGLGRPLCVDPAGPAALLHGADSLPRAEATLALLPGWLGFLRHIAMLRAIDGFAVQYWFYAQLYAIGDRGRPAPERSVFGALREVEARQKRWLAAHRRLTKAAAQT